MRSLLDTLAPRASADDEAVAAREDPGPLCRRVAAAVPGAPRTLVAAVGERLTTIVLALSDRPVVLWTVAHAPLLAEAARADADRALGRELVANLRASAEHVLREARLGVLRLVRCQLVAASRLGRAVVTLGAEGGREATPRQLAVAIETLASTWEEQAISGRANAWMRTTLVGAAMLEGVVNCLGVGRILAMPETAQPLDEEAAAPYDKEAC